MAVNYPPYYGAPMNQAYVMPQAQFPQVQPQPSTGIKGRPVSSMDEVRAISIDFDGSIFYFPDVANNTIYTKQINMDGTSTINVYELKEAPPSPQYVTRDEFEEALRQLKSTDSEASRKQFEF